MNRLYGLSLRGEVSLHPIRPWADYMRFFCVLVLFSVACSIPVCGQQLVSGPVVILIGPPGSGTSEQASAAAKYLRLPIISVSDLIAENAAELKEARTPGLSGMEPETDPILNKFFEARLRRGDLSNGMILDGYPNTKDQADFGSKLVASGAISKPVILRLEIPDDVVRKRLAGKNGKLPASVEQRLKDYRRETVAVEVYFPNAHIVNIDANKFPDIVAENVKAVLKAEFHK